MNSIEATKHSNLENLLELSQSKTWDAINLIQSKIKPGMSEFQAIKISQEVLLSMGSRKFWHKCHVRFGASTIRSFDDEYVDTVLSSDDIFLIDIGPIWDGIEGDAGATFVVGSNAEYMRCRDDAKAIFQEVAHIWRSEGLTGPQLYVKADECAKKRGWVLAPSYVRGHRLGEFPHSMYSKSNLEEIDFTPAAHRWVLEIHICDPKLRFGAFFEDVLK